MILSYDEVFDLMDKLVDDFPPELYAELNGAVLLLPEAYAHPEEPDLYTMGCYCHDQLGRRIELFYGSFVALAEAEDWTLAHWHDELRDTLSHELTHHIEGLAGECGLEVKDAIQMAQYRDRSKPLKLPAQRIKINFKPHKPQAPDCDA